MKTLLSVACLVLAGCSLTGILAEVAKLLPLADALASDAGVNPQYLALASDVLQCEAFITAETASTDSKIAQGAAIAKMCASYLSPVFPPGTPQTIINDVQKFSAEVLSIVQGLQTPQVAVIQPLKANDLTTLRKMHAHATSKKTEVDARRGVGNR